MCFWSSLGCYFGLTLFIFILNLFFVTSIPRPSPLANNIWRLKVLTPYNFYHLITKLWSNYVHKGGKVWKCKCWKRKTKLGLQIASSIKCHWTLAFISIPLLCSFTFHQIPFICFLMTFVSSFFHCPPNPLCLGDKLWAFSKFYMGSSSPIMNSTYLSPNEKMIPIFPSHDSSINVDNLRQANGKLHPNEVILVLNYDSYVWNFHMTNLWN